MKAEALLVKVICATCGRESKAPEVKRLALDWFCSFGCAFQGPAAKAAPEVIKT